jgi:thioredoxin-like negative regulator of GroEL
LTPILEQITLQNPGKFKLVKMNIDKLPTLANGLNVKSIPAVFLVFEGNLVDQFVGIPGQDKLQQFFNNAVMVK